MKDVKVIVLFGKGNTGKSTTLNCVIDELGEKCSKKPKKHRVVYGPQHEDFASVLNYKKKTIGVITAGDNKYEIQRSLKKIENVKCDLYVMASRNYGSSVDYIKELFNNKSIIWIAKSFIDKKAKDENDPCVSDKTFDIVYKKLNAAQKCIICNLIDDIIKN